jgi:hypothetical protein
VILDGPITSEEIRYAVEKGGTKKAPGRGGISCALFLLNWEVMEEDLLKLFREMFFDRKLTAQQKHGVIVLIPKTSKPMTPAEYRPITSLNNDHKIMARLIAKRLKSLLADLLHPSQFCGVPGNLRCCSDSKRSDSSCRENQLPLVCDIPGFQRSL